MSDRRQDSAETPEKSYWLDKPRSARTLYRGLWIVCALLAVADLTFDHHPVFQFEGFPVFYGLYGFIVCFGLVLAAKELRRILKRDEDYYDR
jgi:hypothetical protein